MPQSQARLAPAQYSFAPAQKQITFAGVPGFVLDGLILVVNAATGTVIYDPQFPGGALGGTASGSTVTLAYDTTAMSASDPLRVIYNDLTREDLLVTFSPTTTGVIPGSVLPIKGYLSAVAEIISASNLSLNVEVSIDGANWKTGGQGIVGRLPNLHANGGDTTLNQGAPYNTRQYDISAFRWIRLNVTSISAGSPVVNLLMKTSMAAIRDVYVVAGTITSSFDSGASVGYVRTTSLYPEVVRGTLQSGAAVPTGSLTGGVLSAGAVVTGGARQAFGQPNPYYSRFGATVVSDQDGSLAIQASTDGTNWIPVATQATQAGKPLDLEVKVRAAFYRAVFTNGSAPTGANAFSLLAAFCGA
ncbi:hypothetical protein [Methylobacterium brachiatum]|uniref:hypothetical protein n=1 Tax=Methylobacterium brachiatum TaxID=269660 RepID=UPI0024488DCD|nr:hypothetical protein [Methylobacterium brachiatum]MDH2313166.1 hypothetical protein [Methylobacterium brachiatum]